MDPQYLTPKSGPCGVDEHYSTRHMVIYGEHAGHDYIYISLSGNNNNNRSLLSVAQLEYRHVPAHDLILVVFRSNRNSREMLYIARTSCTFMQ